MNFVYMKRSIVVCNNIKTHKLVKLSQWYIYNEKIYVAINHFDDIIVI